MKTEPRYAYTLKPGDVFRISFEPRNTYLALTVDNLEDVEHDPERQIIVHSITGQFATEATHSFSQLTGVVVFEPLHEGTPKVEEKGK